MAPPTLQRQLLAWALGALTAVWSVFIAIGYLTGVHEADELTDGHLASVAALLLAQPDPRFAEPVDAARLGIPARLSAHDYQHSLSVAVWDGSGRLLARSGPAPDPPPDLPEGFATVPLGAPATDWRVFSRWSNAAHDRRIAVLLSIRERRALESDIALHVAAPGFWLLPLVALVLTLAIRRGLRPLTALSERVGRMDVRQDHRLQAPPHAEFQAMVRAIEALSGRYREALARERELADSFAHELRTPLAALTLHVESLRGALPAAMHDAIVGPIEQDAARTSAIVDDLLALARASRVELAEAAQPLDLAALVQAVVNDFAQHAYESGHELAVCGPAHLPIRGHAVLLDIALRNLLRNALGHTPAGTQVEVRLARDPIALHVCDNGRAAAGVAKNASLVAGLGLGHKVVQRIAAVHGGAFQEAPVGRDGWRCYAIELGRACRPAATDGPAS
jgi:two-component system sensor histidine kinase QseC